MKRIVLILVLLAIGVPTRSQTLVQPYQVRISTNDFTIMVDVGATNLQDAIRFMAAHWHTTAGYLTTNDFTLLATNLPSSSYAAGYDLSRSIVNGTATITRVMGPSVYLTLLTNIAFTVDDSFLTNGDSRFQLSLYGNFPVTFDAARMSNSVAGSTSPSYTNAWGSVTFSRPYRQPLFKSQ